MPTDSCTALERDDDTVDLAPNQRQPLRYHGSKWRLAPWIISQMPPHTVYIEPYGGSAAVLLRKPRAQTEIYNELDGEIVNVFAVLRNRKQAKRLKTLLRLTPFARQELELCYTDEHISDPVERARRTITRSFLGFGSASTTSKHRTGLRRHCNQYGISAATEWKNYTARLDAITERLSGIILESCTALEILALDRPDALFYVDPPYVPETRGYRMHKGRGYRFEMSEADHRELAERLHHVTGMVMISGYRCPLYDEIFATWERADHATIAERSLKRTESLWFNKAASDARLQMRFDFAHIAAP